MSWDREPESEPGRCCDNGFFFDDHDCQKQPCDPIPEQAGELTIEQVILEALGRLELRLIAVDDKVSELADFAERTETALESLKTFAGSKLGKFLGANAAANGGR